MLPIFMILIVASCPSQHYQILGNGVSTLYLNEQVEGYVECGTYLVGRHDAIRLGLSNIAK